MRGGGRGGERAFAVAAVVAFVGMAAFFVSQATGEDDRRASTTTTTAIEQPGQVTPTTRPGDKTTSTTLSSTTSTSAVATPTVVTCDPANRFNRDTTVKAGTVVRFANASKVESMTLDFDDDAVQQPARPIKPGEGHELTLDDPGRYGYTCAYSKQKVTGRVVVTATGRPPGDRPNEILCSPFAPNDELVRTVREGTTVRWVNDVDSTAMTLVFGAGTDLDEPDAPLAPGESHAIALADAGEHSFTCRFPIGGDQVDIAGRVNVQSP